MGRWAARAWVAGALLPLAACTLAVDVDTDEEGRGIRGNGIIETESRDVAGYHRVSVRGSAVVTIRRTGREGVRVTTDENLLPRFETTVRSGTLYLGPEKDLGLMPTEEIEVMVETGDMESLEASGAVTVRAEVGARSGFSATLSGATRLATSGDVDRLRLVLSGASTFDGRTMGARSAHLTASGACAAVVRVTDRLVAWASGVAFVRYIGDPALEVHVSGTAWIGRY